MHSLLEALREEMFSRELAVSWSQMNRNRSPLRAAKIRVRAAFLLCVGTILFLWSGFTTWTEETSPSWSDYAGVALAVVAFSLGLILALNYIFLWRLADQRFVWACNKLAGYLGYRAGSATLTKLREDSERVLIVHAHDPALAEQIHDPSSPFFEAHRRSFGKVWAVFRSFGLATPTWKPYYDKARELVATERAGCPDQDTLVAIDG